MSLRISDAHRQILRAIQADSTVTLEQLCEITGMSQSTLWRRLKELEKNDVIRDRVTIVRPEQVGLSICAFVSINLTSHVTKHRRALEKLVADTPQVMQCFSVTGAQDYVLLVRARDMQDYETLLMDKILSHPSVASTSSNITLREIKFTTALPL